MISKHEIGGGGVGDAARYHDRAFSQDGAATPRDGRDNYYVGEQANAVWQGEGAKIIGVHGEAVQKTDFVAFLEGRLPLPGTKEIQDLADNPRGKDRRAGVDFTISPPKSVSIAGLIGGDERILQAHREANAATMQWFEKHASVVRVRDGHDGEVTQHLKGNLLWATVVHETNRANEPQIHSHNVIVAAVYDKDSAKWRSLTNDQLYQIRTAGDSVYKAELGTRLKALGYELRYTKNNIDFEIKGVAPEHLHEFSSRTEQIKQALLRQGIDPEKASYHARQTATLDSRAAKVELPREVLGSIWQEHARSVGMALAPLVAGARDRAAELPPPGTALTPADQAAALRAVGWAIEHLSERQQAFREPELIKEALQFEAGISMQQVTWAIDQHAASRRLLTGTIENYPGTAWTTQEAVRAESQMVALIQEGKDAGNVILNHMTEFNLAVAAFEQRMTEGAGTTWKLSDEQRQAAHNVLLHPDTFQGIQGEAGTGKTAAMSFVRDVAESQGWQVIGMATGSSAARELEEASGIQSQTVARFFADRERSMAQAQREVDQLRRAVAEHTVAAEGPNPRRANFEAATLRPQSLDLGFGEHRYLVDHQKAEVFRSTNSFTSLIGGFFTDLAVRAEHRMGGAGRAAVGTATPNLGEALQRAVLSHTVRASDALGRAFTSLEKVGTVEANAARDALTLRALPQVDGQAATQVALQRELSIKEAALENLRRTGNVEGRKTLLVMDEASLTGALDFTRVAELAKSIGARVAFQGDVQQHGSVPAGRTFWLAQRAGINVARLAETRRFDNATPQVKASLSAFKAGHYKDALNALDRVAAKNVAFDTAKVYMQQLQALVAQGVADPKVGIVTLTNADRKEINDQVHQALVRAGRVSGQAFAKVHLDDPKLTEAQRLNVGRLVEEGVDRLVMRKTYREIGVTRGDVLPVKRYDIEGNRILVRAVDGRELWLNPQRFDLFEALRSEERYYAAGDQVTARAVLRLGDSGGPAMTEIANGQRGQILAIDDKGATVRWSNGLETALDNQQLQRVDFAYARTTFKEQGATNDVQLLAVSKGAASAFNVEALYVDITRAKRNTIIVTDGYNKMLERADKPVEHTMALSVDQLDALAKDAQSALAKTQRQLPAAQQQGSNPQIPTPRQASQALLPSTPGAAGAVKTQADQERDAAKQRDEDARMERHEVRVKPDAAVSDRTASDPTKEQQKRAAAQRLRGWGTPGALQPTDLLGQNDAGTRGRGADGDRTVTRDGAVDRVTAPTATDAHAPKHTPTAPERTQERTPSRTHEQDKAVPRDQQPQLDLGL